MRGGLIGIFFFGSFPHWYTPHIGEENKGEHLECLLNVRQDGAYRGVHGHIWVKNVMCFFCVCLFPPCNSFTAGNELKWGKLRGRMHMMYKIWYVYDLECIWFKRYCAKETEGCIGLNVDKLKIKRGEYVICCCILLYKQWVGGDVRYWYRSYWYN